jgi:hypothetical protein
MKILLTALPLTWIPVCQWLGSNLNLIPSIVLSFLFVFITAVWGMTTLLRRI